MSAVWQIFNIKLMQCSETEIVGKTYEITLSKLIFGTFWASWNHTVCPWCLHWCSFVVIGLIWLGGKGRQQQPLFCFVCHCHLWEKRESRIFCLVRRQSHIENYLLQYVDVCTPIFSPLPCIHVTHIHTWYTIYIGWDKKNQWDLIVADFSGNFYICIAFVHNFWLGDIL